MSRHGTARVNALLSLQIHQAITRHANLLWQTKQIGKLFYMYVVTSVAAHLESESELDTNQ